MARLFILFLFCSHLFAEEKIVTFYEAIDLAKANSLDLKKSDENLNIKYSEFLLAQSPLLPKLFFNMSKALGFKEQNFDTDSLGLNLVVPFFDGKKLFEAKSKHELWLSSKDKNHFEIDSIINKVGMIYIDALHLEASKNIAKESYELNQQQLLVLEKKLEIGRARRLDLLRSQYLSNKAYSDYLLKDQSYQQKMAELKKQIFLSEDFSLKTVKIESPIFSKNEEELVALAKESKETQSLKKEVLALDQSILAEKLDFLPKLSITADMGLERHSPSLDPKSNVRMLLNFELPLFSGGGSLAMLKNKHAQKAIAEINLQQKEQDNNFAIPLMLEEMKRLEVIKNNAEEGLKAATQARESAERMFKESEATSLEMVEANNNLFNAKSLLATTNIDIERLKLKLLFAVGKLSEILNL